MRISSLLIRCSETRLTSAQTVARTFAAAAVLFVAGSLGACKKAPSSELKSRQVLRLSQLNEPGDLDPATATLPDEFFIIRALSEGLVNPAPNDPEGNANTSVLPGASDRWTVSEDGLTYTFHLRENGRWSNGEPVTSDDFLFSYQRLLMPATGASKASLFYFVKNAREFATGKITDFAKVGFHAPSADTFVVTLERPAPKFLIYASSGPWIPVNRRAIERGGRGWTAPNVFVGNGPFTFAEWRPHQHLTVKRNPNYHTPGAVRLDEIRFIVLDNNDTEERAYRAGQIDITMTVPFAKIATYPRDRPEEFHRTPLAETRYLSFNTARAPLNDERVRRALTSVIDRQTIVDHVLRGGQQPAFRFLPPSLREPDDREDSTARSLTQATTDARQLLADAGFRDGKGFPHLELTTWTVTPVVEVVQQMWKKELGIEVSIVKHDAKVHVTAMRNGNYDIGFAPAIPDVADAVNILEEFMADAPGNYPHWSDAAFESLMEQAKVAPDARTRGSLLLAAERRLLESSPIAPLYFNAKNWLMSPRIRGWQQDALWTRFYLNVEISDSKG